MKKRHTILTLIALGACCFLGLLWLHNRRDIARIDLGQKRVLHIWREHHWDGNITIVYYEIKEGMREIVHQTHLNVDYGEPFDFTVVFTANQALACIYNTTYSEEFFIIFDQQSGESYPRLRDDEVSYDPVVKQKWRTRYRQLKDAYPELPEPGYFVE